MEEGKEKNSLSNDERERETGVDRQTAVGGGCYFMV